MRRVLWWMLGGTSALSALTLWLPAKPGVVAAVDTGASAVPQAPSPPRGVQGAPASLLASPLPDRLRPVLLESAKRDFFVPEQAKPVAAVSATPSPAATPPPPPPAPPPMPYKVIGVMVDPDGRRVVVLGKVDKSLIAAPGMQLDEGFVIESVDDAAVQLLYPALDTRFNLPIPRQAQP